MFEIKNLMLDIGGAKIPCAVFGKGKKYHYYIFSKGGFTNGLKELAEKGEVRLVSLEDMYK